MNDILRFERARTANSRSESKEGTVVLTTQNYLAGFDLYDKRRWAEKLEKWMVGQ